VAGIARPSEALIGLRQEPSKPPRCNMVGVLSDRDRLFNEMWLGLSARWCEPGSMRRRVRAQCPLPGDSVDAYWVHRQDTVSVDV
jgi:hypothetical protein